VTLRWMLAALHLLAFGIAIGSIVVRARALRAHLDAEGLRRVLTADNAWAVSALLAVSTGLLRAFGGYEKGTGYYMASGTFWSKMGLLLLILALEAWPMATLIRWRIALARGVPIDTSRAAAFSRISWIQAALIVMMLFLATAMARGIGY
jgi:putative membrane protein